MEAIPLLLSTGLIVIFFALFLWYRARQPGTVGPFPHRIFQTWKNHTPPPNMTYWSRTWLTYNPSYTYELWNDSENRAFVVKQFPWFLSTYDGYDREIKRADAIRYMYLYTYGGIYADMDFECLKSFDTLLESYEGDYDILLGTMESTSHLSMHSIPNAIMISKPGQDFWIRVLREMEAAAKDPRLGVEAMTGPILLKRVYRNDWFGTSRIKLLEPSILYPISWNLQNDERQKALATTKYQELTQRIYKTYPQAYACTYWTHSW